MTELYIFSQDEQLMTILSEDTGLVSAPYRIEVNSVPTQPFSFTVEADHDNAKYVKDENKVVFKDHEGDWRLMVIKELDDSDTADGPETTATCEPVFLAELNDHIVVERRFNEQTADVALTAAVEGTRWIGEVLVELGKATTNFYYLTSTEAVWEVIATWGGEFKDVVVFNEETNEVLACKVQLLQRRGAEHGQRFEIDHNTTEIGRTVLSYPKTALYGRGASLPTDNGGHTRYIDFADVEWKVANGDPVDKPLGQKWVGDPEAFAEYGYNKGTKHRYGIYSDQDYEDPEELLHATWQNLQTVKKPEVNYRLSVDLFEEKVSLGDTASAIDRKFARPIEIQARVIAMEYDLLDIEGTMVVEMGQFIDLDDNRIDQLEKEVEKIGSRPAKVTEGSYPETKPGTPINVETEGGMEVIQLRWDYDSAIYIKHYEVYGSRTLDFVPDTQHLLLRGNTSGFEHKVGTDEVWYYRVRAVNYHGTVGDFSAQVTGTTHRVLSEDILFNEDTAARLRELNAISDIVGVDGISIKNISQAAKDILKQEAVDYTDEQITITREQLLGDIADKADLSYVEEQLVDKVNKGEVYTISDIDGMFTNTVSITRYTTDMDGIVQNLQSHSTLIEQNEKAILARVETSTFNNETGAIRQSIADVQFYAEGIETTVSNIQIGGRNLLPNTQFKNNFEEWTVQGDVTLLSEKFQGLSVVRSYDPSTTLSSSLRSKKIDVEPGQTYTLSFYGKTDNSGVINRVYFFDSLGNQTRFVNVPTPTANEDWKLIEYTFATDANEYSLSVFMGYFWSTPTGEMFFTSPMLEKGNKATDWTPSPEDADQRMTQAESRITQLADEIDLKVDVDGIVSQINLKKEGIRISGNLIHLDGLTFIDDGVIQNTHIANGTIERAKLERAIIGEAQIEDLAVTAAKIASVNADRINAGAIRGIDIYGSKFRSSNGNDSMQIIGGDIHLDQSNGRYVNVNPDGLFGYNAGGDLRFQANSTLVTSSAFGTSNANVYLAAQSGYEARVVDMSGIPGDGLIGNYSYLPIRASGIYGNFWNINPTIAATHLYARPLSGGELRVTLNESTSNYQNLRADWLFANRLVVNALHGIQNHFYIGTLNDGELRVVNNDTTSSYRHVRAGGYHGAFLDTTATHIYIRPGGDPGEARVTVRGGTSVYQPIRAKDFITDTSLRENKTDIEVYTPDTLNVFRKANIYTYRRINDKVDAKLQLGMMLDEMPSVTYSAAEDSFALYALTSYVAKGVKDLVTVTDKHEDELNWLRTENQVLKNEIIKLKERVA